MNRSSVLWLIAALSILIGAGVTLYRERANDHVALPPPPSMAPQDQAARLTSHLLIRKIEELRDTAVYLQHREEGAKLLELGIPKEETEQSDNPETDNVVE